MKKLFIILGICCFSMPAKIFSEQETNAPMITICTSVVDGNTIVISSGDKVRLIGVRTPELNKNIETTQTLAKQASDYTKKHLEGKQIKLEFDPDNTYIKHRDKDGRLLAYVYYELSPKYDIPFNMRASGRWIMFNARIIAEGYAYIDTELPFKYMDEFKKYEREAKDNKRGLWANPDFQRSLK